MPQIYVTLILMIIAACVAVEIKEMLSSVIALGAVGMGLTVSFLLLSAPDLAITQLVIEILSIVILIKVTINVKLTTAEERQSRFYLFWAVLVGVVFIYFAIIGIDKLPSFGMPIMKMAGHYLAKATELTGATNVVSAIILDFRGYDTLAEATVLFTAVMGIWLVLRQNKEQGNG